MSKQSPFIRNIESFISGQKLISKGSTVIIGVSGGADSMTLLYIFNQLKYKLGIQLVAAHFNHNEHRQAKKHQKFVEEYCSSLNIPVEVGFWKTASKPKKGSLEENARRERLKFFESIARKYNTRIIALAHNKNDAAETVLMRLLRGSGLNGLRGINPKRQIDNLTVIRPLLNTTRENIERFVKKEGIRHVNDPTNRQTQFFRNKIRLKLLPLLSKEYNNQIQDVLNNVSATSNLDFDYIDKQSEKYFKKFSNFLKNNSAVRFKCDDLQKQHPAIKRMVLKKGVAHLYGHGNTVTLKHIEEIEDLLENRPNKSAVHLPNDLEVKKLNQTLQFSIK